MVHGHGFGYYPNSIKMYLNVKEEHHATALQAFAGTNMSITVEGKHHLGAAIGSKTYTGKCSQPRSSHGFRRLSNLLT